MIPYKQISRPRRIWPSTKYINFETGDDSNTGDEPYAPWKHCPGDPNATNNAAAYTPPAGAIIEFAPGVYRGQFDVKSSGTLAAPIVYKSVGTTLSGADLYTCTAASCAGDMSVPAAVRSDQFLVVDLPGGVNPEPWQVLKMNGVYLEVAANPTPGTFWEYLDRGAWPSDPSAVKTKGAPVDHLCDLTIQSSLITTALAGEPAHDLNFIAFINTPNVIATPRTATYNAGTNELTGEKAMGDSQSTLASDPFALRNHPNFLVLPNSRAYQYCTFSNKTRLIVRRPVSTPFSGTVQMEISARAYGINLGSLSDVTTVGFEICDFATVVSGSGAAIRTIATGGTDLRQIIDRCNAHHCSYPNNDTTLQARGVVQRSSAHDCWGARGILTNHYMDNIVQQLNYTGLNIVLDATGITVDRCAVYNLQSTHGNGGSVYDRPVDCIVRNTTIWGTQRGMTVRAVTNPMFKRCVFYAGGDLGYSTQDYANGGFIHWDDLSVQTDVVTVESSILLGDRNSYNAGPRYGGMRLADEVQYISVTNSIIEGITNDMGRPVDVLTGNLFLDSLGYTATGGNSLDTNPVTRTKARAFASFTPTYDSALVSVLAGGVTPAADFYVGCPDFSLVTEPVLSVSPTITGTLTVGSTLTLNVGSCVDNKYNTIEYQLISNGTTLLKSDFIEPTASAPTYVVLS